MAKKRFTVRTSIPGTAELAKKLGVDANGDVQRHVTEEVYGRLLPYIPLKTGDLRRSVSIVHDQLIKVDSPYARAQFFGVTEEGKPFDYQPTGTKVGSHWDRRLVADEGAAIVADAERYARRRRK